MHMSYSSNKPKTFRNATSRSTHVWMNIYFVLQHHKCIFNKNLFLSKMSLFLCPLLWSSASILLRDTTQTLLLLDQFNSFCSPTTHMNTTYAYFTFHTKAFYSSPRLFSWVNCYVNGLGYIIVLYRMRLVCICCAAQCVYAYM